MTSDSRHGYRRQHRPTKGQSEGGHPDRSTTDHPSTSRWNLLSLWFYNSQCVPIQLCTPTEPYLLCIVTFLIFFSPCDRLALNHDYAPLPIVSVDPRIHQAVAATVQGRLTSRRPAHSSCRASCIPLIFPSQEAQSLATQRRTPPPWCHH
jgi:hypothetical protein